MPDLKAPEKKCAECKHWQSTAPGVNEGECRRSPPQANGWPKTKGDDWCSYFRTKNIVTRTGEGPGRKPVYDRLVILGVIREVAPSAEQSLPLNQLHKKVIEKMPMLKTTLHEAMKELVDAKLVTLIAETGTPLRYWAAAGATEV